MIVVGAVAPVCVPRCGSGGGPAILVVGEPLRFSDGLVESVGEEVLQAGFVVAQEADPGFVVVVMDDVLPFGWRGV